MAIADDPWRGDLYLGTAGIEFDRDGYVAVDAGLGTGVAPASWTALGHESAPLIDRVMECCVAGLRVHPRETSGSGSA